MTVNPNWPRRVPHVGSGTSAELVQWARLTSNRLNSEQYISKFSGKSPNSVVTGGPGDIAVNVSLTSGTPGDLWTQQSSTVSTSGWTRLISAGGGGASSSTSVTVTSRLSATAGSSNVTLDLPGVGTAGSYAYVTTDAYGRVTAGSTSLSTASITGSWTTNAIVGSWTTNSIVGTWTSDVSATNVWASTLSAPSMRSLKPGTNVTFSDGGPNSVLTINASSSGGAFPVADGTVLAPAMNYSSESSLGWFRSGSSIMELSYGTLQVRVSNVSGIGAPNAAVAVIAAISAASGNRRDLAFCSGISLRWTFEVTDDTESGASAGSNFAINRYNDVGGFIDGPIAIQRNSGVVQMNSGISVGAGGTPIPAISSISSKIAAMVVQGSSVSFVVVTWSAIKAGDLIICGPYQGTAVSSLSSGLTPYSHCTKAGQFEFRLSNNSTLVRNQSAQTWVFTRISPF